MKDSTPYNVPPEPGRWRAVLLAALVHLALLALFWIGVRWQSATPPTLEAEVWSPEPKEAAPRPQPEPPRTEVKEPPKPEPAPPKPEVKAPPVVKPDIALAQEKKRKELERKRLEEERERLAKKQAEEERLAKLKLKLEQEKLAREKAAKDTAEKEKAERERKLAEAKRKQAEEDKLLAKLREEELKRMTSGVSGSGGDGTAPKSQGGRTDGGYAGLVAAKIKSNISFVVPEGLTTNTSVEYAVDLLPDGSVSGIRKLRSSGVPGFDEAVRRAIEKAQPYPKDKSGAVPSSFIGVHRPKDQ